MAVETPYFVGLIRAEIEKGRWFLPAFFGFNPWAALKDLWGIPGYSAAAASSLSLSSSVLGTGLTTVCESSVLDLLDSLESPQVAAST